MIQVNDRIPAGTLTALGDVGLQQFNPTEMFAQGRHILFAVPGAFTPTCSEKHLPGFVEHAAALQQAGVQTITCVAVNDAFVMRAWGKALNVNDKVQLLADGDGSYHQQLGLTKATGSFGGLRAERYAMVIEDGVVTHLFVEDEKTFGVSSAEHVLAALTGE
ncbi:MULTISPECIES: peroxiredoxin [Pseudidiomarina]|uniref:Glutathione-dependent peroxiredoxin n=2 Tax=Pseudidiomarina TaxID=2800384 RepID=A0A368UPY3_9GAMM|nr:MULTISPECIES: peroxiredoxin [Pseudidiomarina]MDX1526186.1 peroxiredoxin [Pseudidiomarina maritima]PWW10439.1 peroxiredoxin [Pseudidiomarina maritima]RBP88079.1 peroxiredoxin [Pseudidiomarina tainanensis]RCW30090.1 peroxiredoxin [Pseudidiomarina tainanensis]